MTSMKLDMGLVLLPDDIKAVGVHVGKVSDQCRIVMGRSATHVLTKRSG